MVQRILGLRILAWKTGGKKEPKIYFPPKEYHYVKTHAFSALAHLFVSQSWARISFRNER